MRVLAIILLSALTSQAATTWYVRPGGASYGANNGTSYANAWPGLTNLVFGSVASADTVYVCGTNNDVLQQKVVPSATYRMDYATDPGYWSNGRFWIATNTTFYACHFLTNYPLVVNQVPSTNIVFDSCSFLYGIQMDLYYHYDYWTFRNCEIGYAPNGIYTHINGQPSGPNFLTVSNCYIHHTDVPGWADADGHAIGVQGGSGCIITKNTTDYTGSAIEFDSLSCGCSNNVVSYNYIQNTHQAAVTGGHGIGFSADAEGFCISNRVFGNVLRGMSTNTVDNVNGYGIAFNRGDYLFVANNTISNCARGVSLTSTIAKGLIENNIVNRARQYAVSFAGQTTPGDVTVDYNLYYPANNCLIPTGTANVHSVVADPLFVSASPIVARDFKLKTGSTAINAGTLVGLTADFSGVPIPVSGAPDIGAFQYGYLANSCSMTDVQMAVSNSVAGDIVLIPAGTCTWTTNVSKPGVGFVGAGIDTTMIVDEVPRTLANKQVFIMSGTNWQLSGLTVTGSLAVTTINYDGAIRVSGEDWRIHDMKMVNLYAIGGVIRARRGLVDHCTFKLPVNETFQVYDADTFGYASWNTPVVWGSTNFVRMQDNLFADNSAYPALDFYGGARVDISHNVFTNTSIGNHGTDSSGAIISCRAMDVHSNLFIFPPGTASSPWPFAIYMRGGTARVWNNKFQGRYTVAVRADVYRRYLRGEVEGSPNWTPWGGVTGVNVWDGNTDSIGYPALHSIGRGQGDLLAGNPPVNVTRGSIATWTHDALDPVYCWSNSLSIDPQPDGTNEMRTSTALVIPGRDYYVATADPAYTGPLIYPDPLITGVNPPSPTLPPLPATNLRIISVQQANGVIILNWDASLTGTVNNYSFYVSNTSNNYGGGSPIGNVTSVTVSNLDLNKSWFFAVTATDGVTGLVSAYSIEVEFDPAPVTKNYATGNGNLILSPLGFGQW